MPFDVGKKKTQVTASHAIMVGKGNQKSPAAVAGMQIDYGKFRQMFFDQTKGKCGTNGDLACYVRTRHMFSPFLNIFTNLFVISKNETTNSPIHQFTNLKCGTKAREPFKPLFNGVFFLIYYFKKRFKPCFFILKALKDILQHFKFVNWFF